MLSPPPPAVGTVNNIGWFGFQAQQELGFQFAFTHKTPIKRRNRDISEPLHGPITFNLALWHIGWLMIWNMLPVSLCLTEVQQCVWDGVVQPAVSIM